MTVSTTASSVSYLGNGSATSFAVPFKVLDEDHLVVTRQVVSTGVIDYTYIGTDYSYSGLGDDAGTLTLDGPALSSSYRLIIERTVPYTQELNVVNVGGFYPETVEEQLDLTTMQIQQIADATEDLSDRAVKVAVGDTVTDLPPLDTIEGKLLGILGGQLVGMMIPGALSTGLSNLPFYNIKEVDPTVGDPDNPVSIHSALNTIMALVSANNEHGKPGGPTIYFPPGDYHNPTRYSFSKQVTLVGQSNGMAGAGQSTVIRCGEDQGGFYFAAGSDGSVIQGMDLFGEGTDEAAHGIESRVRITLIRTSCRSFPGHGWYPAGDASLSSNTNCSFIMGGHMEGNGLDGIHIEGGDANAIIVIGTDCRYNGNYGGWDQPFLGGLWIGCHFDQNGIKGVSHNRTLPSLCTYSGDQYYVVPGQETAASTTTPGTDATIWRRQITANGVRGTPSTAAPTWVSGMSWRAGGPFCAVSSGAGHTVFLGCYSESSQPASYLKTPAISIGGTHGAGVDRADGSFGGTHGSMVAGELGFTGPIGFRSIPNASGTYRFSYIGGMDASLEAVWRFGHSVKAPQGFRWRFPDNDAMLDYGSDPAKNAFFLVTPASDFRGGRAAAPVGRMIFQEAFFGVKAGDKARGFHSFEGVPDNAVGGNGDFGWRHDAGTGVAFLYHKVAGAWVSVLTHP